jgi:Holliday junction resolvasome RuvABC DNA-binding subunit
VRNLDRIENRAGIIASLVNNGFSRSEASEYVKALRLERKERRITKLVKNAGIKRAYI